MSYAAQMNAQLNALRDAIYTARFSVNSSWSLFSGGTSQDASNYALDAAQKRIDLLAGTDYQRVESGTLSFESWSGWAKETFATIKSVDEDVGTWNFSGVVGGALAQTAEDVQEAAKDVGDGAVPVLLVVAVIVVGLVVLRVS